MAAVGTTTADAIATYAAEFGQVSGLRVEIESLDDVPEIGPKARVELLRIVQEALTNSLKHGGPATAEVVVSYGRHQLELEVLDDGHLGDSGGNGTGHGLVGMRERVTLYGGVLEAGPRQQGGFAVHAWLPLDWSKM